MSLVNETDLLNSNHPIDVLETLATSHEWPCERGTEDDMNVCVAGKYCDFHLAVSWRSDLGGLHIACVLDTRIPPNKRQDVLELLALINEQLWSGHFDIWSTDGSILFRNTVLVTGEELSLSQCASVLTNSIENCERFFPAFQYIIWSGHSASEALEACMFETKGDA
ncbi:MAG: YbjN domain-containing protein [Parvibaculales bacterium]